jgi:DNA-binding XRE family transcriptional regulator
MSEIHQAKKLAEEMFSVARERILTKYGSPDKFANDKVRQTNNIGSYLPALIQWASDRVRDLIIAFAESYAQAFTESDLPLNHTSEEDLRTTAGLMTAGTIAGLRGHVELYSRRTRSGQLNLPAAEIEHAKKLAVKEGVLILRGQRIKHVKANTLGVLGEEGLITGVATLELWHKAFVAYKHQFPELGHFGLVGERWFSFMERRFARWDSQNALARETANAQRETILRAWLYAKTTLAKPKIWVGYRSEFAALRKDEEESQLIRKGLNRLSTVGDFARGFSPTDGDSRISAHFAEIAARAGGDLGPPIGCDPSNFWHVCVFQYLREQGNNSITVAGADGDDGGSVREPIAASEELCSALAVLAFKSVGAETKTIDHKAEAILNDEDREMPVAPEPAVRNGESAETNKKPQLNLALIRDWYADEGWTIEMLATKLGVSKRTVSSILNNGDYHGSKAVNKLAELMNLDVVDLYL